MPPSPAGRQANLTLALLFGVNFLNYIDRYVVAAVLPMIQADFKLDDKEAGLVLAMFMIVYTLASPFTGIIGDRFPRRFLVGSGVILWSLATVATGLAGSLRALLAARGATGIGEAGFGAVSPTIISDLYPKEIRGRMLSFFYVAIPVGSALGYLLGGWVGQNHGWRAACYLAGAPGILLGILALFMYEPPRGGAAGQRTATASRGLALLKDVVRTRSWVSTTLAMSAMTFALGGMAGWMPTYFQRERGWSLTDANTRFGAMTVLAGLIGTFLGGWLGDWLLKRTRRAYLLLSGAGMLLAVPCTYVGLTAQEPAIYVTAIFLAEVLVFLNTGPANAVIVNVVMPEVRATAIGISIFVYHFLGDASSPVAIGWVADRTDSLTMGLMLTPVAMAVSGALYLLGGLWVAADTERVANAIGEGAA